jgi:predicted nucleotidyltransferase
VRSRISTASRRRDIRSRPGFVALKRLTGPAILFETMSLLAEHRARVRRDNAALCRRTRVLLRHALARHLPGVPVWVYGSILREDRFHPASDVDLAVERLPVGMTLDFLQSLVSRDIGREVDVCLLERTRLRPRIEAEGERWIE